MRTYEEGQGLPVGSGGACEDENLGRLREAVASNQARLRNARRTLRQMDSRLDHTDHHHRSADSQ